MRSPCVLLALALAAACGPGDFAESGAAADAPAQERRAAPTGDPTAGMIEADRAFARATAERGADGWTEWFEPEGSLIRGSGEIVGHADIRAAMEPLLSDATVRLRWSPSRAVASEAGDLGYTVGPYEVVRLEAAPGEDPVLARGLYLTVWRRQADGSWKVVADIGNPAE